MEFMLVALNDVDVYADDIGNTYLNGQFWERICDIAVSECVSDEGSAMIIVRALYGPRSSGASWRSRLYNILGKDD